MTPLWENVDMVRAVLLLLSTSAFAVGGYVFYLSSIRAGREALARRSDLVLPRAPNHIVDERSATVNLDQRLLRLPGQGFPEKEQREIVRCMTKFGFPRIWALTIFALGRLLAAVLFGLIAMIALPYIPSLAGSILIAPLAGICAVAGGWVVPPMLIRMSIRRRAAAAVAGLPEALDLLVVCVDAGLSLEDALSRVIGEMGRSHPELADELALTSADLQILPSRDEALAKMADRVDLPSMRSFVSTLTQTLRFGTPLAQGLRAIGAELRNDTLIKLEERANQLPALLTVPLMLFIMPTIFLIIGGPAALRLMDVFGR